MSDDSVSGTKALRRSQPVRRQAAPEDDMSNTGFTSVSPDVSDAYHHDEMSPSYTTGEVSHSYDAIEASQSDHYDYYDEEEHQADLIMEKKIELLQKQVNANHAETTATLVLAAKIEENPVVMRTLAEAFLLPTAMVHSSKLLERELAHQTFATRDEILSSSGYEVLEAYCHRHDIETPQEEADRVTGGKSLLEAIKDLIAAGRETEKVCMEAQEAGLVGLGA